MTTLAITPTATPFARPTPRAESPAAAAATVEQAEPPAPAFYIVTTLATVVMFLLSIEAVASMVYFFSVVYTSWSTAGRP